METGTCTPAHAFSTPPPTTYHAMPATTACPSPSFHHIQPPHLHSLLPFPSVSSPSVLSLGGPQSLLPFYLLHMHFCAWDMGDALCAFARAHARAVCARCCIFYPLCICCMAGTRHSLVSGRREEKKTFENFWTGQNKRTFYAHALPTLPSPITTRISPPYCTHTYSGFGFFPPRLALPPTSLPPSPSPPSCQRVVTPLQWLPGLTLSHYLVLPLLRLICLPACLLNISATWTTGHERQNGLCRQK